MKGVSVGFDEGYKQFGGVRRGAREDAEAGYQYAGEGHSALKGDDEGESLGARLDRSMLIQSWPSGFLVALDL